MLHELSGIGAIVTDPPYSSGGAFRGDRMGSAVSKYANSDSSQQERAGTGYSFTGDTRDQRSYFAWCALWMMAARKASVPGATIACFTDWRQLPTTTDAVQAGGWIWRGLGAWSKKFGRPRAGGFSSACEFLVWGTNGPMAESDRYPSGVVESSSPPVAERDHLTQKPELVIDWAMGNVPPSVLVADPFMGSGTTLAIARRRGQRAIGIDVDEHNCEVAARRLSQSALQF